MPVASMRHEAGSGEVPLGARRTPVRGPDLEVDGVAAKDAQPCAFVAKLDESECGLEKVHGSSLVGHREGGRGGDEAWGLGSHSQTLETASACIGCLAGVGHINCGSPSSRSGEVWNYGR